MRSVSCSVAFMSVGEGAHGKCSLHLDKKTPNCAFNLRTFKDFTYGKWGVSAPTWWDKLSEVKGHFKFDSGVFSHAGENLLLVPRRAADEDVKDADSASHHLQVSLKLELCFFIRKLFFISPDVFLFWSVKWAFKVKNRLFWQESFHSQRLILVFKVDVDEQQSACQQWIMFLTNQIFLVVESNSEVVS